jgi:xanthine dehydrogenase iron-sulfur cluster and FAD-binding subunit A
MTVTALLRANPHPTADEVRLACAGNVCRCGSQPHIVQAALRAAGGPATHRVTLLRADDLLNLAAGSTSSSSSSNPI